MRGRRLLAALAAGLAAAVAAPAFAHIDEVRITPVMDAGSARVDDALTQLVESALARRNHQKLAIRWAFPPPAESCLRSPRCLFVELRRTGSGITLRLFAGPGRAAVVETIAPPASISKFDLAEAVVMKLELHLARLMPPPTARADVPAEPSSRPTSVATAPRAAAETARAGDERDTGRPEATDAQRRPDARPPPAAPPRPVPVVRTGRDDAGTAMAPATIGPNRPSDTTVEPDAPATARVAVAPLTAAKEGGGPPPFADTAHEARADDERDPDLRLASAPTSPALDVTAPPNPAPPNPSPPNPSPPNPSPPAAMIERPSLRRSPERVFEQPGGPPAAWNLALPGGAPVPRTATARGGALATATYATFVPGLVLVGLGGVGHWQMGEARKAWGISQGLDAGARDAHAAWKATTITAYAVGGAAMTTGALLGLVALVRARRADLRPSVHLDIAGKTGALLLSGGF